jgi:hypothetical protein
MQVGNEYLYTGDLWTSSPDHLKSHDLQYWEPLIFDDSVSPPNIAELRWLDEFNISAGPFQPQIFLN